MNTPAKLRVLVVDNQPASTRLVRLTLERHAGFEVCEVNDPRRTVAAAQRFQPGLILLDVEMPNMDGGQVARALQEQKGLAKVPVVFMTSLVTESEAGHDIFLQRLARAGQARDRRQAHALRRGIALDPGGTRRAAAAAGCRRVCASHVKKFAPTE